MSITVIVGLGNPGPAYAANRHNLGFRVVNVLAQDLGVTLAYERSFKAEIGKGALGRCVVWVVKPQTYMNVSAEAVAPFLKYYAHPVESVCVVHDDTAFPVGVARFSQRESSGGHNGLKSLIQSMGPHFLRYRLGIDQKPHPAMDLSDHVLGNFSPNEEKILETAIPTFVEQLKRLIQQGPEKAMNTANR